MTEGVGERPSTARRYLCTLVAHSQPGVLQYLPRYDGIVGFPLPCPSSFCASLLSFCPLSPAQGEQGR